MGSSMDDRGTRLHASGAVFWESADMQSVLIDLIIK